MKGGAGVVEVAHGHAGASCNDLHHSRRCNGVPQMMLVKSSVAANRVRGAQQLLITEHKISPISCCSPTIGALLPAPLNTLFGKKL